MHLFLLSLGVILLGDATAVPKWGKDVYAVKERHTVPRGWTRVASAPDSHLIHLRIGLRPQNLDHLRQNAVKVSDPSHAHYGQYLSSAEIRNLVAPSKQSINLVQSWLLNHDIDTATSTSIGD